MNEIELIKDMAGKAAAGLTPATTSASAAGLTPAMTSASAASGAAPRVRFCLEVPLSISARHVHLSPSHLEELFGPGYQLQPMKDLSQPGQYAAHEQVTLVGPKGIIEKVRILGPTRSATQVEISRSDSFRLGISDPPVRDSGQHQGSPGITIVGPQGAVTLPQGVILAMRHLHLHPDQAAACGLADGRLVRIHVGGERELTFGQVLVRVNSQYAMDFHLDVDEANAAGVKPGMKGLVFALE